MEKIEKILMKIIIIQFLFLLLTQFILHQLDTLPELQQLTKYEGVNENSITEILQTFQGN
ncbi:YpfB family protein [Neobacillus sp. SAB-20_R2A]|uniref:YpfB family protein n=1 Tax=Neobacillus sp. SAB-20_R2A TaxID=3120519 RepID=UPI003C6DFCA2